MRHTLNHSMSPEEAVEELVEGNEVALAVLTEIVNKHKVPAVVMMDLDDMNIRGKQIPIALELCNGSITKLVNLVSDRSQWLADEINKQYTRHKAVTHGAAFGERE